MQNGLIIANQEMCSAQQAMPHYMGLPNYNEHIVRNNLHGTRG